MRGRAARGRTGPGLAGAALLLALAACSEAPHQPDIRAIYGPLEGQDVRRPLIRIPGTLGSRLVDGTTGELVWGGGDAGLSADPDDPEGARLIALPIPAGPEPVATLSDEVVAAGVLDVAVAEVLGLPLDIEVYGGIRQNLSAAGFRLDSSTARQSLYAAVVEPVEQMLAAASFAATPADAGITPQGEPNSFRFDYDWRRDIAGLAAEFDRFMQDRTAYLQASRAARGLGPMSVEELRCDLLAHSMGSLLARYYLMHGAADLPEDGSLPPITWAGARYFETVVFMAPPNGGSVVAFENLVNGKSLGPFQPRFPAALLGTHPSTYQLMPRSRHAAVRWEKPGMPPVDDLYDPALWQSYGWGLADPEADALLAILMPEVSDPAVRRERAVAQQARLLKRAKQFHAAIDRWSPPPPHLKMYLVVGGGFRTPATARIDPLTGEVAIDGVAEGDGVVLRTSALLDERIGQRERAAAGQSRRDAGRGLTSPLRFNTVLFLPDEHVELTKNPVFADNLLFWLLEEPREVAELRVPGPSPLVPGAEPAAAAAEAARAVLPSGSDR